jgi:choline-sulfatase
VRAMPARTFLGVVLVAASVLPARAAAPNIIIVTLDTTRADRMGFLGSLRGLTPYLDLVAKSGVVFLHAYSQAPLTTVSHATILTGTYPQFHRVSDFGLPLPAKVPSLAEVLHQHGYRTAAFVGSLVLDPAGGMAPGFDKGFDAYVAGYHSRRGNEDRYHSIEHRAEVVVADAISWLAKNAGQPFFLWIHIYDPHDPYDPPSSYLKRFRDQPYDGEIAYSDAALGKLFTYLREHRLYDGALIAIMGDHGEALGQHGEQTHGIFLYDETIHVPLVFKLPGDRFAGRRVRARVGLVDVAPTVFALAGIAPPDTVQGESLLPLMKSPIPAMQHAASGSQDIGDRVSYAETDYPHRAFGWSSLRALRKGKYLFIEAPKRELYDESSDPNASRNLDSSAHAVSDTFKVQLDDFRRGSSSFPGTPPQPNLDPQQVEQLGALGYVASAKSAPDSVQGVGADPKDKIQIANLLHDAMLFVEEGRYGEAISGLQSVLADDPQIFAAQLQLGIAWARRKEYEKALAPLQKAVALLPDSGSAQYELGLALFETGDWKGAVPHFEVAVQRHPKWPDARFSLAAVYARIDRVPEALAQLDQVLQLNPQHYQANLLRGRILSLRGDPQAGLPNLEEAVKIQPKSSEAHLFLAQAYSQLGREEQANRELNEAQRLKSSNQR